MPPTRLTRPAALMLCLGASLALAQIPLAQTPLAQSTPARPKAPLVPTSAPVTAPGGAQGSGGLLPLVSVGERWTQNTESYSIVVAQVDAGKPLGLEVYSPALNLLDYADGRRGAGYFGDELYRQNEPFETVFSLSGPGGVVAERRYAASREHGWESLLAGGLPAGTYTLSVRSSGDGKNSFALRVAPPFALETADFSVNARDTSQQDLLVARLRVPPEWVGQTLTLSNYDADGPQEARTWVVQPGGKRVDLTLSGDNQRTSDSFKLTAAQVGDWQLYLRVLPTTKQYSNAVQYSFRLNDKPIPARVGGFADPGGQRLKNRLLVEVVDKGGKPIPGASFSAGSDNIVRPRLPQGYLPLSATLAEGTGSVTSPTEVRVTSGSARVRFVARPQQGSLSVDAVAVYGATRLPLTAVPFTLGGKSYSAPATLTLPPGSYPLGAGRLPGASVASPPPAVVTDNSTGRVTLEYQVRPELTLQTSPDVLDACDVAQLTAEARSDFPYPLPSDLSLSLPPGWSSDYPLGLRGDLSAGKVLRLKVPVRICRTDSAEALLAPTGLRAGGDARVRDPAGVNVTRSVQGGARVHLAKSAQALRGAGDKPGFMVTLTLTSDGPIDNLRLLDPLPTGASTPPARSDLQVQGPGLSGAGVVQDGDSLVLPHVVAGSYTVQYTLLTDLPADRVVTTPGLSW